MSGDHFQRDYKNDWQRAQRRAYQAANGFSTAANYAVGGIRRAILERDGYRCVQCRMTAEEHMAKWNRQITVDHIDRDRRNNAHSNLQTLCLSCHGRKDRTWKVSMPITPIYKPAILRMRREGKTFDAIADFLELSAGTVHKWFKRWEQEPTQ